MDRSGILPSLSIPFLLLIFGAGLVASCDTNVNPAFLDCPPPKTYTFDGNETIIPCSVFERVRECIWYYNATNITSQTPVFQNFPRDKEGTCNLNITITESNTGNYTCVPQIQKEFKPVPAVQTQVILYRRPDRPTILNMTEEREVMIDETLSETILCESDYGVPPPKFYWYIGGDNFTYYAEQVNSTSTLSTGYIGGWFAYNRRNITCQIKHPSFGNLSASATATLMVSYHPRLLNPRKMYTVLGDPEESFTILFKAAVDTKLDENMTKLSVIDSEGNERSYVLGEHSDDGQYVLSEAKPIEEDGKPDFVYFTLKIKSVTEDVQESKYKLKLFSVDGKSSRLYHFTIYTRNSATKWLFVGIGITVTLVVIGAIIFALISRKGLPWRKTPSCISLITNKKNSKDQIPMQPLSESRRSSMDNTSVFVTSDYQDSQDPEHSGSLPRERENKPEKSWLDTLIQVFIG